MTLPAIPPAVVRRQTPLPVRLPGRTELAEATAYSFHGLLDGQEHVALVFPDPDGDEPTVPLVRVHSECVTGDVLGSARCDCGPQLDEAVTRLAAVGGILLYLRQEGRGIGLFNKLDAYALQDAGLDTFEANRALGYAEDGRDYSVAVQMLRALGVERLDLLSNNPDKAAQLTAAGLVVRHRLPTGVHLSPANARYLAAKADAGHWLLGMAT